MADLKWMSVWCRQFAVNFGDVYFPADLKMDEEDVAIEEEEESIPEELPPPLIEPIHNAHDPNRYYFSFNKVFSKIINQKSDCCTVWLSYPFDSRFSNFAMKRAAYKAVFIIK